MSLQIGDLVWAKMTGYPFWPGKVVNPQKLIKKPGKKMMYFVRFYGTGDHAWTKPEYTHKYSEDTLEKYISGSKRSNFLDAVEQIAEALKRRQDGMSSDDEEAMAQKIEASAIYDELPGDLSDESDDQPLSKKSRPSTPSSIKGIKLSSSAKKKRKTPKALPTREEMGETRLSPDSTNDIENVNMIEQKKIIPTDKKIGFLGLGIMGAPMAMNLIRTGHDVTVWNRNPSRCKPLVDAGAKQGMSASDVVSQCDITFSCCTDDDAVKDILNGTSDVLQGISADKGYVEMSTIDRDTVTEIAEKISRRGGRFLEAPVTGSKKPAEQGQLVILAAGDRSLYMDAYSCFEAMGKKTFFLGELGSGADTKLIVNMLVGTFMTSLAEGLSLAEKAGLDQYTLLEVLNMTDIACPLVRTKGSAILEGHFPANFPLKHQQKDLRLALQMGEKLEQPLHVAGASNELYKRTKAIGYGDRDMSCVFRAVNA